MLLYLFQFYVVMLIVGDGGATFSRCIRTQTHRSKGNVHVYTAGKQASRQAGKQAHRTRGAVESWLHCIEVVSRKKVTYIHS